MEFELNDQSKSSHPKRCLALQETSYEIDGSIDAEKGSTKQTRFVDFEENEGKTQMAHNIRLVLRLSAAILAISIMALVIGLVAFLRTNDSGKFTPFSAVSLDRNFGGIVTRSNVGVPRSGATGATLDQAHSQEAKDHGGSTPHWTYQGAMGPSYWGSLSAEWAVCDSGAMQSPINIDVDKVLVAGPDRQDSFKILPSHFVDVSKLVPTTYGANDYADKVKVHHNGHAIQADGAQGFFQKKGKTWKLLDYHLHTPSEHSINGRHYAAEVHFVHQSFTHGDYLVVGVLVDTGIEPYATAFDHVLNNLPASPTDSLRPVDFDYSKALQQMLGAAPDDLDLGFNMTVPYFTYPGSFTTPPCTEAVTWVLLEKPISFAEEHIEKLKEAMGVNNRPVLPVNNRTVIKYT